MTRWSKQPPTHPDYWVSLEPSTRRRQAVKAAVAYDYSTLYGLIAGYLKLYPSNGNVPAKNTMRSYKSGCKAFVLYAQANNVSLLNPSIALGPLWRIHLEQVSAKKLAPGTVEHRLQAARLLFKALNWARVTRQNPFMGVRAARDRTKPWNKRQPYPQEDITALLQLGTAEERLLVLLGAHGGLRISEVLDLTPADVNLQARRLTVRQGKGNKRRSVRLTGDLLAALRARMERHSAEGLRPDEVLFEFTSDDAILARMRRLCADAQVPYLAYHSLRHSCGTAVSERSGLEAARQHLGHEQLATTLIYAKWNNKKLRQVLEEW